MVPEGGHDNPLLFPINGYSSILTCESVGQEENHEKASRREWANNEMGNVKSLGLSAVAMAFLFMAACGAVRAGESADSRSDQQPEPLALLQTVAHLRQQIRSGEMQLDVSRYDFSRPLEGTNRTRLKIAFDGDKRRFDSLDREYAYVLMGPDAARVTDAKMRELGLDNEAAVAAGLLTGFASHHVTAYDGAVLMDYWETDGKPCQTQIDDPAKGSSSYIFDPRCLGLRPYLFADSTIAGCLDCSNAESVTLSNAFVGGIAAWHVRILLKSRMASDFWIDAGNPSWVLKSAWNGNEVTSKYDAAHPDDPIPTEVLCANYSGRDRERSETRFVRRSAQFNVPVDPASWTLAGLDMPIGAAVLDYRINRRIGYWNGSGLSENPPPRLNSAPEPTNSPTPEKLLALAQKSPQSTFGLDAATWVMLNTPDGPQVENAGELIRRYHLESTNLVELCEGLERLHHRGSAALLRAIIETNRDTDVLALNESTTPV